MADTCNVSQYGPCTLPCTATTTPTQVLSVNGRRRELMLANTGSNTLYVILGQGNSGQDATYGLPLAPGGILDFEQGNPAQGVANPHTWTSAVWVVTAGATTTCVYAEQNN